MTAPHGTGLLYVHRDRIADLWPLMAAPEPRGDDIRKFEEIGTHPSANRLAISEAVTIFESLGAERKAVRMRYLRDRWAKRLASDSRVHFAAKLDETNSCGFTTMSIDGIDPDALSKHLWHHHRIVVVPISGFGINGIRVSPNVYTTTGEVDMFSRAVEAVLANGLPA
jgi:selenocysteine lyase/cysteine desulfurase